MEDILRRANLSSLLPRFQEQKIESTTILSLTDGELTRLGVTTIGDRVRLRELCSPEASSEYSPNDTTGSGTSTTTSGSASLTASTSRIRRERSFLFSPHQNPAEHRRNRGNRAKKCKRTWTGQFVCLADRNASSVPSSEIKQILTRAGLGLKRLTFDSECKSRDLMDTLMSDAGFPQLRDCGGVELLHCAYAKQLKVITCNWSVPDLKTNLGSQSKIYIRPIQKNLSTKPISSETDETLITQTCMGCNKEFNIRELRDHLWTCTARSDEDEDDVSYDRTEEQEDLNIIDTVDNTSDTANGTTNMISNMDVQQSAAASNPDNTPNDDSLPNEETVDDVVTATYEYCNTNSVSDPVEI
ncbi:uncharacterized protein [Ptychodera flava]|uniref:uncharacterized protein n=1 Tax=Ptychodera flava TaxID=63121 RepID=UPI00396AAE56